MRLALFAALLLAARQDPDPAARATVERSAGKVKVLLESNVLYDGPGAKAELAVVRALGERFLTVRVDGDERVRLWVKRANPLEVAPADLGVGDSVAVRTDTIGDRATVMLVRTVDGKRQEPVVVFEGPAAVAEAPSLISAKGQMELLHNGEVIYRAPRRKPEPAPGRIYAAADFIERLNAHRRAAGAGELKEDPKLTRACDLHALYLVKNLRRPEASELNAHKEVPGWPGYTEEGADAAGRSVIHFFGGKKDLVQAVDALIATFYHRMVMLEPRLDRTGVGWAFDPEGVAVVVLHTGAFGRKDPAPDPLVYPAPDQKGVPREFGLGGREVPDPVPDPRATPGYPITLQWGDPAGWRPKAATATVSDGTREIPCWISTPDQPARKDFEQPGWICVIPQKPLEGGRRYTVRFACRRSDDGREFAASWSFTTAP